MYLLPNFAASVCSTNSMTDICTALRFTHIRAIGATIHPFWLGASGNLGVWKFRKSLTRYPLKSILGRESDALVRLDASKLERNYGHATTDQ
jgi:hypothetical protein